MLNKKNISLSRAFKISFLLCGLGFLGLTLFLIIDGQVLMSINNPYFYTLFISIFFLSPVVYVLDTFLKKAFLIFLVIVYSLLLPAFNMSVLVYQLLVLFIATSSLIVCWRAWFSKKFKGEDKKKSSLHKIDEKTVLMLKIIKIVFLAFGLFLLGLSAFLLIYNSYFSDLTLDVSLGLAFMSVFFLSPVVYLLDNLFTKVFFVFLILACSLLLLPLFNMNISNLIFFLPYISFVLIICGWAWFTKKYNGIDIIFLIISVICHIFVLSGFLFILMSLGLWGLSVFPFYKASLVFGILLPFTLLTGYQEVKFLKKIRKRISISKEKY